MISQLRGIISDIEGSVLVLDVQGVGYEVQVPLSVLAKVPGEGSEMTMLIRQIFREDGVSLYGFSDRFQRRMFDLLLEVKGCGPKVALSLLGIMEANAIAFAIIGGDSKQLAKASGVGPKLADRIILEIKDKSQEALALAKVSQPQLGTGVAVVIVEDELVDALLQLGYRRQEAEIAAIESRESTPKIEDQLRRALQILRKT